MFNIRAALRTLLCCAITFYSTWPLAAVQLIAEIGQPAAGLPANFVYWQLDNPAISPSGHIAFTGAADTSIRATANNINAVWAGLPGKLKVVIKENDAPTSFPPDIKFHSAVGSNIVVTQSGHLALNAQFKGDVSNENDKGLLAFVNQQAHLVLRTGDQAPDFPAGVVIRNIQDFVFTDAGMLIQAEVASASFLGQGIWFWDYSTLTRIASPLSGCNFKSITGLSINQSGEGVFSALLLDDSGAICSPSRSFFKWHSGNIQAILSEGDPVPGMIDTIFTLGFYPLRSTITDQGEIIFTVVLKDTLNSELRSSVWVARNDGQLDLLALDGETLTANPDESLNNPNIFPFIESTNNGLSILVASRNTDRRAVILFGEPRPAQPYSHLNDAGTSQLSLLAQLGDQPPGFDDDWFIGVFTNQIAINKAGQFAFSNLIVNSMDVLKNQQVSIWRGLNHSDMELVANTGMTLFIDNSVRTLDQIQSINRTTGIYKSGGSTVGGSVSQFSDKGEIIFTGNLSGSPKGVFLITDGEQERKIFSLAEQLFPELFSPATGSNQNAEGYLYRHYEDTNTYIGIRGDEVFVLGEQFGPGVQRIDTIENTIRFLETQAEIQL